MSWIDYVEKKAKDAAGKAGDVVDAVVPDPVQNTVSSAWNNPVTQALAPIIMSPGNPVAALRAAGNIVGLSGVPGANYFNTASNIATSVPAALSPVQLLNTVRQIPGIVSSGNQFVRNAPGPQTLVPRALDSARDAGSYFINDPKGAVLRGASAFGEVAGKPREAVVEDMGAQAYYIATHNGEKPNHGLSANPYVLLGNILPDSFLTRWANDPTNWPAIIDAYQNGQPIYETMKDSNGEPILDENGQEQQMMVGRGNPGDRAVWELYAGTLGRAGRILADTAFDPLNAIPGAGALGKSLSRVGKGIEVAEDATQGARTAGAVLNIGGNVLGKTAGAIDRAGNLPFEALGRTAKFVAPELSAKVAALPGQILSRFESQGSKEARGTADLYNNLDAVEGALDQVDLPPWAEPKTATGQYEVVEVDRNTGASYIVDPAGNPVPGSATTGKGATAANKRAAAVYNKPDGAKPTGRTVSPPVMDDAVFTPAVFPPEGPTLVNRDYTPAVFFQEPEQRAQAIGVGDISPLAPRIQDTRIPSTVERQMATNPESAYRYYQTVGIDPNTGQALPNTPAFLHDERQRIISGTLYPDFFEKIGRGKLTAMDHVINTELDAYRNAFAEGIAPTLRESAQRPLKDIAPELAKGNQRAFTDLMERSIYANENQAQAAIRALEKWGKETKREWIAPGGELSTRLRSLRQEYRVKARVEAVPTPSSKQVLDVARDPVPLADPETSRATLDRLRRNVQIDDDTLDYLSHPQGDLDVPVIDAYFDAVHEGMTHADAVNEVASQLYAKTRTATQEARTAYNTVHPTRAKLRSALGKVDTASKMARENTMYNVANAIPGNLGDRLGNRMMLFQEGKYGALARSFDPRPYFHAFRGPSAVHDYYSKESHDLLAGFGKDLPEHVRPRNGATGVGANKFGDTGDLILTRATKDSPYLIRKGAGVLASQRNANIRHAMEGVERSGLTVTEIGERLPDNILDFKRELQSAGMPADTTIQAIQKRATESRAPSAFAKGAPNRRLTSFSPEDVLAVTGSQKLAQSWQRRVNAMYRDAGKEATRVYFAGARRYGIDDALGKAVFFHFWASRALAQQAKAMARSPRVFNAYYQMITGAMHEADEKGYPDSFRGLLHYWGDTDAGFYALFNPLGVLVPAMMFSDLATMGGSDTSGSRLQKWMDRGSSIMPLAPWVTGAAAALGLTDATPNFTGTARIEGLVNDVINYGNTRGLDFSGGGLIENPPAYWTREVLKNINAKVGKHVAGQTYQPYNPMSGKIDNVNSVLYSNLENELGPTDQWGTEEWGRLQQGLEAIRMGGAENPDAERALQEFTAASLLNRGASSVLPQGSVVRFGPRQNAINANTPSANTQRNIVTADATTQPIIIGQQELNTLGTDRQKGLYTDWNNIVYGVDDVPQDRRGQYVQIGDQRLTVGQIAALPHDQRVTVADAFINSVGGAQDLSDYRKQRDEMVEGNPALATFDEYKSKVGNFTGGVPAFRTWAASVSPQFKSAQDDQIAYLRNGRKLTGAALDAELDDWAFYSSAYAAFRGDRDSIYDPDPLAGASVQNDPMAAFPSDGGSGYSGSSGGQSIADRITRSLQNYQQDLAAYQAAGGPAYQMPGVWNVYQEQQYGSYPQPSADLQRYLAWAEAMGAQGQDASPLAYEAYITSLTPVM